MNESRIIIPAMDNDGASLATVHDALERDLCTAFGGCTVSAVHGSWIDPATGTLHREPGLAFDVAAAPDAGLRLRALAVTYGRAARQLAVYFRAPTGRVQIIDLTAASATA